ncbi:gliding motility-associated C-terminal domain-containing protein [Hymenobacter sp. HSC-4F20]|uniref:T9SS type B sorting domain-containing protein n=1 Tax=Hymenobacter sp. HSC-4F20 TaxID=2864135 RepID=UPI001C72DD50|nr:gliding motility-associated C-terminal domain-containing protein [Hymenobacter sp. HSC-4F20]MBX0290540.1 gliding motility-associated C-terminal domain-containing protein [Hymenobacter sp. HSC-4F20]
MNLSLLNRPVRLWLAGLLLLVASLGLTPAATATHLRAGDIQATIDASNFRTVHFQMVLYIATGAGIATEDDVTIFFGDNTSSGLDAIKVDSKTQIAPGIQRNIFKFDHTYNAPGAYQVSYISVNRVEGVVNITNSVAQSFYISTLVTIDPLLGINRSPVLTAPAIDRASRRQVFLHNPAAFDADGDSLSYELRRSQSAGSPEETIARGNVIRAAAALGFRFPDDPSFGAIQVPYSGPPVGQPGQAAIFQQDIRTGQIVWNSPEVIGDYNVAFVVREWRRVRGARPRLIGEVIRDMQITVTPSLNLRPLLVVPPDICVVAGTPIPPVVVTATDPDNNPITLEAFGGIIPPATFVRNSSGPPTARGTFNWTPTCANIQSEPHQVVFKATDQPTSGTPLIDERPFRITVVGPPPQNLRVTPVGNTARLDWSSYTCQNPGAQIRVYRREGPSGWTPGPCETGIPASRGYTQIGTINNVGSQTFLDDNNGRGLERGKTYCYRIYVQFALPAGGASIASEEACLTITGRSARLTNVTVDRTDATNGQITVRWNKPTASVPFTAPNGYRLYRAVGQNPAAGSFTRLPQVFGLNDTVLVDTGLNTTANSYTYRLEFFRAATTNASDTTRIREQPAPASSVRVTATPNPLAGNVSLSWTYAVPWDNSRRPTTIYRRTQTGGAFVPIAKVTGTTTGGTFVDQGTPARPLVKNETYCYYVKTNGVYDVTSQDSLINLSQEQCVSLLPVPCTPVLTLRPTNCDSLASRLFDLPATTPTTGEVFSNYLSWTLSSQPTADCSRDITEYIIYYAPNDAAELSELARVPGTQTTYVHQGLTSAAGCYAVRAVDRNQAVSAFSNKECKDNCLLFLLPNVFTPNGDGKNDTFRPKVFSPIERTTVRIYNRWGTKVYESDKDPLINWSGGNTGAESGAGSRVSEGMYYYTAEVEFKDLNRTKRTFKGWVQINR